MDDVTKVANSEDNDMIDEKQLISKYLLINKGQKKNKKNKKNHC